MSVAKFNEVKENRRVNKYPYTSLEDINKSHSGIADFTLDGKNFTGYVDSSHGGGWLLILQYVHDGGTNPVLVDKNFPQNLPILSTAALGADESADATRWGEMTSAFLRKFPDLTANIEFRLYAITSAHNRVIHFRTKALTAKFRDNTSNYNGVRDNSILLPDHTALIPQYSDSYYTEQNLHNFPFYIGGQRHWGIRGLGNRWEVDDYPANSNFDTIHRVWARYNNSPVIPHVVNGYLFGNTSWTLTGNVTVGANQLIYSSGDTPINGVASQDINTLIRGTEYELIFSTTKAGTCAASTAKVLCEVIDINTNQVIASAVYDATVANRSLSFLVQGPTRIRFTDQTVNTVSCDMYISNIMIRSKT